MKLELSDEEVKLLIDGLEDLLIVLLSVASEEKGPTSKVYNAHVISVGLLLNKIKKQTEVKK